MVSLSLYNVPAPGQCLPGEDRFLGTVRIGMHKAPLTALAAGLRERLAAKDVELHLRVVDMQTVDVQNEVYGELDYQGLMLEKHRVGTSFSRVTDTIKDSDIVGINANYTHSRLIVTDFAQYAKKANPEALVVIGGTDATQDPDYYLRRGGDIVVKGEGEGTLERLCEAVDRHQPIQTIANLAYHDQGRIVHTPKNFLSQPFDVEHMPPPDLGVVDLSQYYDTGEGKPPFNLTGPFISVETSRGCAQACTFCATPSTKGRYRFMKLDTIRAHFEYFKQAGVETLLFQEDNVLSRVHRNSSGNYAYEDGRQELLEMFRLARRMGFTWEFTNGLEFGQYIHQGRVDLELIETMFWHEMQGGRMRGCYRATLPLENLSDESSRLFRKLKPLGESGEVIKAVAQTGVNTLTFNLIVGRPQDDAGILKLSYDRCLWVKDLVARTHSDVNVYFNVYNLSLFPGTVDFRRLKHLLAFDIERDPEVVTFYLACLNTDYFSALEMTQARGTMTEKLNGSAKIADFDETFCLTHDKFKRLLAEPVGALPPTAPRQNLSLPVLDETA
jgi:hopanoid C-3 methylase